MPMRLSCLLNSFAFMTSLATNQTCSCVSTHPAAYTLQSRSSADTAITFSKVHHKVQTCRRGTFIKELISSQRSLQCKQGNGTAHSNPHSHENDGLWYTNAGTMHLSNKTVCMQEGATLTQGHLCWGLEHNRQETG